MAWLLLRGRAADAEDPRRYASATRGATWFPLTLFGVVALASSPLYALEPIGTADLFHLSDYQHEPLSDNPGAIAVFWLIAAPLGYVATFFFYRARARRREATFPTRSYLLTGLALLVLLVANFLVQRTPLAYLADLYIRGLTPLFVVATGVFVLARSQHSWPMGIFAVGFLGLVVLVNLYGLSGLTDPIGLSLGYRTNVDMAGAVLVLAGAALGVAELTARRRTT